MLEKYNELVEHPDYLFLCAVADQKIVGAVMGIVCHSLYGDCRPFLLMEDMIVDQHAHRRGIGSALMRRLELFARNKHCTQILFITETTRPQAVAFYESLGYNAETHVVFEQLNSNAAHEKTINGFIISVLRFVLCIRKLNTFYIRNDLSIHILNQPLPPVFISRPRSR
ncbi:MAG: GNAT family N-acetyltransferase [candidate division KSB1 bacterium]|nr:GNAT family N-acetyltransferase [candidate division KSB1 bacterium]